MKASSGQDRRSGLDRRCSLRAVVLHPDADMLPRYRAGDAVLIELAADPVPGDDVLLMLRDGRALVRELAALDAEAFEVVDVAGTVQVLPLSEVRQAATVLGITRTRAVRATAGAAA